MKKKKERKERKERIIYDNYSLEKMLDDVKDELVKKGFYLSSEDVPENIAWEEVHVIDSLNWEEEISRLKDFMEGKVFVVKGRIETWKGSYDGGAIIQSFDELRPAWNDCSFIKIYDIDGHFHIQASHHDGTNYFEMKKLSKKGSDFLKRNQWEDRKYLCEKLWRTGYSVLPNFAHICYGCPKRETV